MAYGPNFRVPAGLPGPGDPLTTVADLPSKAPAAASPIADRVPSDVVGRAAAILAREVPAASAASAIIAARGQQGNPAASIDELHRRATAVLSDLFSYFGAQVPPLDSFDSEALSLPWRRPGVPAPVGSPTSVSLQIENLEDYPVNVSLFSSELLSDGGSSIPSFAVSFDPLTLNLGPGQQGVVVAKVNVPQQAIPGAYSGLVQAAGLSAVKAVITVDIC
jgi:hypothetical protein